MRAAKYYIYRNLRTKGFSIRYRGIVIDRLFTFTAEGVELKVNELGRQRVIKERQKNVHAFVIADKYIAKTYPILKGDLLDNKRRVTYNPYVAAHFMCDGKRIDRAETLAFQNGLCFVLE